MPKTADYKTLDARANLLKDMWDLANMDVREFASIQPFGIENKTQYSTNNSAVKKPVKNLHRPIENTAVELHIDLNIALQAGSFIGALQPYFQLNSLLGG